MSGDNICCVGIDAEMGPTLRGIPTPIPKLPLTLPAARSPDDPDPNELTTTLLPPPLPIAPPLLGIGCAELTG